ncbi:MAG: hypothetical protein GTN70_04210 [Deltaproteobacteria bacterium]|nr:hypothetical protein [Deltaproteobacteria bacterium]NIS76873.1 hypothetical protein [Deltaproteobacteria bacterium]
MRILIVKISAFGDIIHALPILPYLKKIKPGAQIYWAVDRQFEELLKGNPYLDGIFSLPIRQWKKQFRVGVIGEAFRLIRSLRTYRFDICFDVQGNTKSGLVSFLSGAKLRCGFDKIGVREFPNIFFTNRKVNSRPEDIHISQKVLRVISGYCGENVSLDDVQPMIYFPDALREKVREKLYLQGDKINMAIHGGTSWETKKLRAGQWVDIITAIDEKYRGHGLKIFFTWGSKGEREESAEIIDRLVSSGIGPDSFVLCPFMEIKELAAFYSLVDVVIGADTGPIHLAAASGGKTLSYYTAPRGARTAPVGPRHRFIQADYPCTGCFKMECPISDRCKETLTPDKFLSPLEELLPA